MKCSIKVYLISALPPLARLALWGGCFLLSALPLNACPLCKETISAVKGLAEGFYWSTLLLLAVPFFVVAVITSLVVKAQRQQTNKPH